MPTESRAGEAPLVQFDRVELGYGRRAFLPPLDLAIRRGDFWGVVGPNGSGKTTLVRTLLGIIAPVGGKIRFGTAHGHRPRMGYVAQRDTVDFAFPLSVLDVVTMGRYGRVGAWRTVGRADRKVAQECLLLAGIAHLAGRPFNALSGGEKQRALMARALAGEPDLLLLDEPTNGMDLAAVRGIMDLISTLNHDRGLTVVFISHQLNVVANYVRNICIVHREDQKFCVGDARQVLTSESLTDLYGRKVVVWEHRGHRAVFIDRPEPAPREAGQ